MNFKEFRIAHLNVRSLQPKIDQVSLLLTEHKFDMFAITETWLDPRVPNNNVAVEGYNLYRHDRCGRGGGVCWYIRSDIDCDVVEVVSTLEQLWLRISLKRLSISCGVIYKPPNIASGDFITCLEEVLAQVTLIADEVLCVGDFNIDMLRCDRAASELTEALEVFGLQRLINEPTRVTVKSATLLDVILFSNDELVSNSGVLENDFSDHSLVFVELQILQERNTPLFKTYRDFRGFSELVFYEHLKSLPWRILYELQTIDEKIEFLNDNILLLLDIHAPLKIARITKPSAPWISVELKAAMQNRDKLLQVFKRSRNPIHWQQYKSSRNLVTNMYRKCKREYLQDTLELGNVAKTWQTLKATKLIRSKRGSLPNHLTDANVINDFFIDSLPVTNATVDSDSYSKLNKQVVNTLAFSTTSESDVLKVLQSIRSNAVGSDGVSIKTLLYCMPFLLPYVTHIVNFCIQYSVFPSSWKTAVVRPIPKVPNPILASDLRPISILTAMSKILEKIINVQLQHHLEINEILPTVQSGFRQGHSCTTALACVVDDIIGATDRGYMTILVLLDYTKAFDTVNHRLLLAILKHFGLEDSAIVFFEKFLNARQQYVQLSNCQSNARPIRSGVAQGSVLSPTLFSIYTAPLINIFKHCKVHFYADDTQVYISYKPSEQQHFLSILNAELSNLVKTADQHSLIINPNKSKVMIFGRKTDILCYGADVKVTIQGSTLPILSEARNLGLVIDTDLRFRKHVSTILQGAYAKLKSLYPSRHLLNIKTKTLLCNSLILSKFNFGDVVYGPCLLRVDEQRIQKAQNACLRFIYGIKKFDRISHKLLDAKWLSMSRRTRLHSCVFYYNIVQKEKPQYLYQKIQYRTDIHNLNLRFRGAMTPPLHRTEQFKRCFSHQIVTIYNALPPQIKLLASVSTFKKQVFDRLLDQQTAAMTR